MNPLHYTKCAANTYESIRQLIDDIDTFSHTMVVFPLNDHCWTMRIEGKVLSSPLDAYSK